MRASQRGNALFRAGVQPLRQPRAPTSRHPPLEIEPSRRVTQRRYSRRLRRGAPPRDTSALGRTSPGARRVVAVTPAVGSPPAGLSLFFR